MKTLFKITPLILLLFLAASGCHLFKPWHPEEGEGEGEVVEGEVVLEGETVEGEPVEGEIEGEPAEGEALEGEPAEGEPLEGELEGELPEGEPAEGEPGEGEPAEGEATEGEDKPDFLSADRSSEDYGPPTDILDEPEGGEEDEESRELVEPDVIRRSGNLLYILNQYRGLTIADLDSEKLLSQTPTYGYPRDLYLVGTQAYVLVSYAREVSYADGVFQVAYGSRLYVFDVSDPAAVLQKGSFAFEGDLVDSRMVGQVIYAVCSDYTWYDCCEEEGVIDGAAAQKTYGSTWATSLNIADPENIGIVDAVEFGGYGNLIQATNYAIFTVTNDYNSGNSQITYVDISDPAGEIVVRATAMAPGYMADRFKMDAWNGTLRVVTNTWWPDRQTWITTFNITDPDTMAQSGQTSLANASSETLFATRFDGPLAYIVTYMVVDPLFIVDLSDPAAPTVLGELKIPGWSTHIEPRGDRLIALGVDDTEGRRVMVSLFDVSNPQAPTRLDYASFGEGWSWSAAYGDVKAFTILDDMILVPFTGWNYGSGGYDRLQFIGYTRDSLDAQGYVDLQGSALRSFRNDGLYYALTQEQLAVIDATNPAAPDVVNTIVLAENIADVVPLPNGWAVEVITRWDSADTVLRATTPQGDTGKEITLPVGGMVKSMAWKDTVAVVSSVYEYDPVYKGYYLVYLVDFSDPANPEVTGKREVRLEPWYGGWWWGPYGPEVDGGIAESGKDAFYPWYRTETDLAFLAGDYLVLRGSGTSFDAVIGDAVPWQGLGIVYLAGETETAYVGLGYDAISGMESVGDLLYITTKESRGVDGQNRPICAYYLRFFDPALLEVGAAVNVPGVFCHRVPGTGHLLFQDQQYAENGVYLTLLRCGALNDNMLTLTDSLKLPFSVSGKLRMDGNRFACAGYEYPETPPVGPDIPVEGEEVRPEGKDVLPVYQGYVLGTTTVSDGIFGDMDRLELGQSWCSLLGLKGDQAFLAISDAAVARCDLATVPGQFTEILPVMGYPNEMRFGADTAYVPMGYSGVLMLPL